MGSLQAVAAALSAAAGFSQAQVVALVAMRSFSRLVVSAAVHRARQLDACLPLVACCIADPADQSTVILTSPTTGFWAAG